MNNYNLYKSTRPNWPNAQRIKNILFLVGIAIVLGLGLALARSRRVACAGCQRRHQRHDYCVGRQRCGHHG